MFQLRAAVISVAAACGVVFAATQAGSVSSADIAAYVPAAMVGYSINAQGPEPLAATDLVFGGIQSGSLIPNVGAASTPRTLTLDDRVTHQRAIEELTAPGDLDTTFGQGGTTTVAIPGTSTFETGNAVAMQSDGKAVVVGSADSNIAIMRLNSDGSLDTTFGFGGKVASSVGYEGDAVAIQPDGKIVVGGLAGAGPQFVIARYLSNGDIDQSFGTLGATTISFSAGSNFLHAIAIQSDGKIIAVGQATTSESDFGVARLNTDGSLDPTFGSGGKVTTDFPGPGASFDAANAVTVQSDGKILVSGVTASQSTGDSFGVARYLANGTLDSTFGTGGLVTFTFGTRHSQAFAIGVQSTGKIVVGGQLTDTDVNGVTGGILMGRLNPSGSLDPTFGNSSGLEGVIIFSGQNPVEIDVRSQIIFNDDSILVGGSLQLSGQSLDYMRSAFDANGNLVTAFRSSANLSASYREEGRAMTAKPDGSLLYLVGVTNQNDSGDVGAVVASASTFVVESFGQFPVAVSGSAVGMALQSDGKIVAVGQAGSFPNLKMAIVRLNPDGTRDPGFGSGGVTTLALDGFDGANGVAIQSDGKIVVAGLRNNTSLTAYKCVFLRFNPNGTLDATFGVGGVSTFDTTTGGNYQNLFRVLVQPDGKIVASGSSNGAMLAIRLLPDGSPDPGFATGGIFKLNIGSSAFAIRLAIQSDNKIVLAGTTQPPRSMVAVRLNTDGTLDSSFGSGGVITPAAGYEADALAIQQDGKLILAGVHSGFNDSFAAVRCLTNGALDPSFGNNGTFTFNGGTFSSSGPSLGVSDAAIQTDGRIVVGGYDCPDCVFQQGGHSKFALWRLTSNGNLDPSFGNNGLATTTFPDHAGQGTNVYTDSIAGLAIQPDGKIAIVGTVQASLQFFGFARYIGATLTPTPTPTPATISGTVAYGTPTASATKFIAGVVLTASGTPSGMGTSDTSGNYLISGLGAGPYTVTPGKTGDVAGIASLDAARAAQFSAGLFSLTANQQIAADSSNNGTVSSFDAAQIARYSAGFNTNVGITGQWKFVPASRNYPSLSGNLSGENYDAILVGDVTGNWAPPMFAPEAEQPESESNYELSSAAGEPVDKKEGQQETIIRSGIAVTLPTDNLLIGKDGTLEVPVIVGETGEKGIASYDLRVNFDATQMQPADSPVDIVDTVSRNFTVIANTRRPGQMIVSAFGINDLAGSGTLLKLRFRVSGDTSSFKPLTWAFFRFNEDDGSMTLMGLMNGEMNMTGGKYR